MSKWTKGPWRGHLGVIVSDIPDGDSPTTAVAYVGDEWRHTGGLRSGEERDANARLIASAPALVEALEEMVEAYWGLNDDKNGDGIDPPPACIIRARAALASAKGNTGEGK